MSAIPGHTPREHYYLTTLDYRISRITAIEDNLKTIPSIDEHGHWYKKKIHRELQFVVQGFPLSHRTVTIIAKGNRLKQKIIDVLALLTNKLSHSLLGRATRFCEVLTSMTPEEYLASFPHVDTCYYKLLSEANTLKLINNGANRDNIQQIRTILSTITTSLRIKRSAPRKVKFSSLQSPLSPFLEKCFILGDKPPTFSLSKAYYLSWVRYRNARADELLRCLTQKQPNIRAHSTWFVRRISKELAHLNQYEPYLIHNKYTESLEHLDLSRASLEAMKKRVFHLKKL